VRHNSNPALAGGGKDLGREKRGRERDRARERQSEREKEGSSLPSPEGMLTKQFQALRLPQHSCGGGTTATVNDEGSYCLRVSSNFLYLFYFFLVFILPSSLSFLNIDR
jgi:hypothetical protein